MLVPRKQGGDHTVISYQKLIFLHIPKCGGTYVQRTFAPSSIEAPEIQWKDAAGHLTYREYVKVFNAHGDKFENYLIFTVVRNPWAWHVSWFNYVRNQRRPGLKIEHRLFRKMSFQDYLVWLDDDEAKQSKHGLIKKQQTDWLIDECDVIKVSRILQQESLYQDLTQMTQELNLAVQPQPLKFNVSTNEDYRSYYNSTGIDLVARRHDRDIRILQYRFD